VEDLAQAAALLVVGDLARHADAVEAGHQHQVTAGDADVGAQGRPLGADAFLDHLDDHLLPATENILDERLGPARARTAAAHAPAVAPAAVPTTVPVSISVAAPVPATLALLVRPAPAALARAWRRLRHELGGLVFKLAAHVLGH